MADLARRSSSCFERVDQTVSYQPAAPVRATFALAGAAGWQGFVCGRLAAMRCCAARGLGWAIVVLLLASPVQAITITFGDIEITPEPPPRGNNSHGYTEYVFYLHNTAAERAHTVSLSIPYEKRYTPFDSLRELRRTVQVGATETVRLTLLQPDHPPVGGSDVEVTIDGRRQDREVPLNVTMRHLYYGGGYPPPTMLEMLILLGPHVQPFPIAEPMMPPGGPPGMGTPVFGMPAVFTRGGPPGMGPMMSPGGMPPGPMMVLPPEALLESWVRPFPASAPSPMSLLAALRVADEAWHLGRLGPVPRKPGVSSRNFQFVNTETWSSDWLAYSRYDGIVITATDLKSLRPDVRGALWQYVETGGALLVLGKTDLEGLSAIARPAEDDAGWITVRAGFGVCRVSPDANYEKWSARRFVDLEKDWNNAAWPWQQGRRGSASPNQEFPIIEDLGIPIKGLFVLMLLFTLAIGPINLLILTHWKRRIWMLWTTPAISLCTCLAVFGYMLISEGWQGRLRSATLTLLDESTHRATTVGWTGVYSPLTPGDGLHFRYETEVIWQRFQQDRASGALSCSLNWSQDQHLASGWVEARVPAHFKVRKSEMRRERVSLQRERAGRWSMVNGLGAPIRRFWYADDKGQLHTAENIAAGARAALLLTDYQCEEPTLKLENTLVESGWIERIRQISAHPSHFLRPGRYLAEIDDSPFLEDALRNARDRKAQALVIGFRQQEKNDEGQHESHE